MEKCIAITAIKCANFGRYLRRSSEEDKRWGAKLRNPKRTKTRREKNNAFMKVVVMRKKGVITQKENALLRLFKRRYYALPKGTSTPY